MQIEPKLREHKVVPFWTLPDKHGEPFDLARKRGKEHFILLICAPAVDPSPFLQQLAPAVVELRSLPAAALVVVDSEDAAGPLPSPPFRVLIDASGKARERYLSDGVVAGLFLLDRYGDLYRQWLVSSISDLPPAEEVSGWMEAIGMQCSI